MENRFPQVDKILRHPILDDAQKDFRRTILATITKQLISELRSKQNSTEAITVETLASEVLTRAKNLVIPSLRNVINGTGVVLNTNLGRAPIASEHIESISLIASSYTSLEIDLENGKRGKRSQRLQKLLTILTGAESALVVNNNAAAIVLIVNCFSTNREVVISRGELIEIGGSFRLPEAIVAAGGKLREVGTTNKTRISDFEKAAGPSSGIIMRCHQSNFKQSGFIEECTLSQMVELSQKKNIPLVVDLGSGVLFDLIEYGISGEPTVAEIIAQGCDLVTFSGDKLLGGPQAGIITGREDLIEKLSQSPLYRALRPDKITISLLEKTLGAYLNPEPQKVIPLLSMLSLSESQIKQRVQAFIEQATKYLHSISCLAQATHSTVGGGSLPGETKPSWGICLESNLKAQELSKLLRDQEPPVISLIQHNKVIVDFRTVLPEEENLLHKVLKQINEVLSTKNS